MIKIMFVIHDLGPGGAEKSLVNLVNHLDPTLFDITVKVLFDGGVNRDFLHKNIHYEYQWPRNIPANSHWMKLWTPEQLYRKIVSSDYNIVISFLEGPSARVIGGCPDAGPKVIEWVHTPILSESKFREGFRDCDEARRCYRRADRIVFVSEDVKQAFGTWFDSGERGCVLYNIYDVDKVREMARNEPENLPVKADVLYWCGMGKLIPLKGWSRMLRIQKRLIEKGLPVHFLIIGDGPQRVELEKLTETLGIRDSVTFLGYQKNPYQYLSRCDLWVCASEREGFSTAAVEALLCGTAVCTVDVSGMRELLDSAGVITENEDEALYLGIIGLLENPQRLAEYKKKAAERAKFFDVRNTIDGVTRLFLSINGKDLECR